MSSASFFAKACVVTMCLSPALLLVVCSVSSLLQRPLRERSLGILTQSSLGLALGAAITGLAIHFAYGATAQVISYGEWFSIGRGAFSFDFLVDGMSLGFATLSLGCCVVVAAFSLRYLHLDRGFHRYFVQLAIFVLGITLVALAGSIEVLFAGWELIGLSSALLVGFYHERSAPVRNALRVFAVYRVSDAAMLSAAVLLHAWTGSGDLSILFLRPASSTFILESDQVLVIATLILVAVAGKSALLPFSGWLPRAMEGPTPSSAVYYGAISIHAGCFLLLRAAPLLEQSAVAQALAVLAGISTALYATLTARVQTDIKSALAYASLTQVGLIVVEIALGFTLVAFIHIVGHTFFRLLQFLSAPNVLHDLHELESRVGNPFAERAGTVRTLPKKSATLYLAGLERGFVDPLLDRLVVAPFLFAANRLDQLDRALTGSRGRGSGSGNTRAATDGSR